MSETSKRVLTAHDGPGWGGSVAAVILAKEVEALESKLAEANRDWALALASALGMSSGLTVPLVPDVDACRNMFAAVRAKLAEAEAIRERALDMTQAAERRAELEELRREVLETVADVCLRADDNAQAPWPWPLTRLGAELRRRVERLEGG